MVLNNPSPLRCKAALFDLDGTLVHTAPDLAAAMNHVLAARGRPQLPLEMVEHMVGNGARVLLARGLFGPGAEPPENDPDFEGGVRLFLDFYEENIHAHSHPYPGVEETLEALAAKGIRLAVVTNKPEDLSVKLLEGLGLSRHFEAVVGSVRGGDLKMKPHPDPILHACRLLDVTPAEAVMVGDSDNDVFSAQAAGTPVAAVPYGYNRKIPVEDLNPDRVLRTFSDLETLLTPVSPKILPTTSGSTNMSKLKLGVPKGSLEKATIDLFEQAGWSISVRSRNYFPSINDSDIECSLVRPQEMGPYVADGTLDLGLTGHDWIIERDCENDVTEIAELEYSKASNQPCRWVLVVPGDSPIKTVEDLEGKTIATELVEFTKRYLKEKGVNANVVFSWGATEAKVVQGLVDAIVEITETGSTIKAHGLRIVCDLLETRTKLIANPAALKDPAKKAKIDQLSLLLKAALDARHKVLLKMNVKKENCDAVCDWLPSMNAPTVSPLHHSEWFAVETVVNKTDVRDLIPKLAAAGAEGILEFDLQKVV